MTCECIKAIEAELPEHKLELAIMMRGNNLTAETCTMLERRDNGRRETRSKRPRVVAHKFCPFCGTAYGSTEADGDAA